MLSRKGFQEIGEREPDSRSFETMGHSAVRSALRLSTSESHGFETL